MCSKPLNVLLQRKHFFLSLLFLFKTIRYDLRIRYIPSDFMEKLKEDKTTMLYFYHQVRVGYQKKSCVCSVENNFAPIYIYIYNNIYFYIIIITFYISQVRSDYMQHCASKVSDGMALQLGCLEIRYQHCAKHCAICLMFNFVFCSLSVFIFGKFTIKKKSFPFCVTQQEILQRYEFQRLGKKIQFWPARVS